MINEDSLFVTSLFQVIMKPFLFHPLLFTECIHLRRLN